VKIEQIINEAELDFYQDKDKTYKTIEDIKSKLIPENLKLTYFRIEFSYKTIRGNNKENIKYIRAIDTDDARFKFIEYINQFNKDYSFRPYLNAKILKCAEEGSIKILIN
jgi:hypothetical protein